MRLEFVSQLLHCTGVTLFFLNLDSFINNRFYDKCRLRKLKNYFCAIFFLFSRFAVFYLFVGLLIYLSVCMFVLCPTVLYLSIFSLLWTVCLFEKEEMEGPSSQIRLYVHPLITYTKR